MASKLCDSCKSATAALFCRADSAFLCLTCDSKIHAAASRHARVWVCEQAPAHVTCKADAAALCAACDRDIHAANPLARRHDRVPVTPFYDTAVSSAAPKRQQPQHPNNILLDDRCFDGGDADVSREEAEAASWLLPNPPNNVVEGSADLNAGQFLFPEMMGPYLDLDYGPLDPKVEAQEHNSSVADGVVPVQSKINNCFELEFSGSKSFHYTPYAAAAAQSLSPSVTVSRQVSSPSLEAGVVPDGSDISNPYSRTGGGGTESMTAGNNQPAQQLSAVDREARVLRYREKRKNRKFEKTIRYASRKAYAETRPRVKGRFAKRTEPEIDVEVDHHHHLQQHDRSLYTGFGVVPSF